MWCMRSEQDALSGDLVIFCDRKIPIKLNGKFYRTTTKPAILCGSVCWE